MPRRHFSQIGIKEPPGPPPANGGGEDFGYPRPQLRRSNWTSLNGPWDFALDPEASWNRPAEVRWDSTILVPFSPETPRSGIGSTELYRCCWYRRRFEAPALGPGERLILHFGAVDYQASVWVDGTLAVEHEGGYTPFWVDLTLLLGEGPSSHEIVVRAEDDPADLCKPRGKQDWQLEPHSIWYPRTTGIWQTVWMERVPTIRMSSLRWTANLERWEIELQVQVTSPLSLLTTVAVKLRVGDLVLAHDHYTVVAGEVHRRIALSDPGIDDFRNELLWSPAKPTLIEAEVKLLDEDGAPLDVVASYTALRSFDLQGDRFVLNGRPYPLRMVLDQGYWPESGMTPPSDGALRRDVELTKAMGFNGARKHQKIEDPRYLYWADRLGLLVWEEMPSAYRFTKRSVERVARQWLETLERDMSHPCIIAWVPFNESWGVPNLPANPSERHYVQALYHLTKTLDPTRPVVGNDGWESVATDIIGIHDYDESPERLGRRYWAHEVLPKLFKRERPGGRSLVLEGPGEKELPLVLSEFGGIAFGEGPRAWGYSHCKDAASFGLRFTQYLQVVRGLELFAGFCYTQFADTYQEVNGLLYADRTPKIPIEQIAAATRGPPVAEGLPMEPSVTERTGAPR